MSLKLERWVFLSFFALNFWESVASCRSLSRSSSVTWKFQEYEQFCCLQHYVLLPWLHRYFIDSLPFIYWYSLLYIFLLPTSSSQSSLSSRPCSKRRAMHSPAAIRISKWAESRSSASWLILLKKRWVVNKSWSLRNSVELQKNITIQIYPSIRYYLREVVGIQEGQVRNGEEETPRR